MWETLVAFLSDNAVVLGGAAALAAIIEVVFKPFRFLVKKFRKPETVELAPKTLEALKPNRTEDGPKLTIPEFIRIRKQLRAELLAEMDSSNSEEQAQLRARIAELESQLANPDKALKEAQARIADLEDALDRAGNEIGGDKLEAARKALRAGDTSLADDLFAEVEARAAPAVESSAWAAFARGEIAEGEVRWADAAAHYARAARLAPTLQNLQKAAEFAGRSGDFQTAKDFGKQALALARKGDDRHALASVLNTHAITLAAMGEYEEAEALYREALEIDAATIGKKHPNYATHLNNLAGVLRATGKYEEAEALYREALEIAAATIGKKHPSYAANLNNLAAVLEVTGKYEEAEALYREALEIDAATIGKKHPHYATRLNNLAGVLWEMGKYEEAEALYREALEIDAATIGKEHPGYATDLNNLAAVLEATGKYEEAEALYREALEIDAATIGKKHPDYAIHLNNLAVLHAKTGRFDEAIPMAEEALAIREATLGAEHSKTIATRESLAAMRRDAQA